MKPSILLGLKHFDFNFFIKTREDWKLQSVAKPNPFPQKGQNEGSHRQLWAAWHGGKGGSSEKHGSRRWLQMTRNSTALPPPYTQRALDTGNANKGKPFFTELCGLGKGPGAELFCLLYMLKVYKKKNQADPPSPCHAWWDLTPSHINTETPAALRGGRISPRNVIWTLIPEHIPATPEAL